MLVQLISALIGVFLFVLTLGVFIRFCFKSDSSRNEDNNVDVQSSNSGGANNNAPLDIWSISSTRVNVPDGANWPTHNGHISLDSFIIRVDCDERNRMDKDSSSSAPPAYSELGLPSYEEAVKKEVESQNKLRPSSSTPTIVITSNH